ncbi:MAG: hypothetical protein J0L67_04270 [Cytophagales bacterium]|nr:hypothetical protein [Cytophagales bacterium]
MKQLNTHMEDLHQLLTSKGFNGSFLTNAGFPGTLKESLVKHLQEVLQGTPVITPFFLTTYSRWNGEAQPHVKCDFKVHYNRFSGFRIATLDAQYRTSTELNPIRRLQLQFPDNHELPTRDQVNTQITTKKKNRLRL